MKYTERLFGFAVHFRSGWSRGLRVDVGVSRIGGRRKRTTGLASPTKSQHAAGKIYPVRGMMAESQDLEDLGFAG